jgi:hypothetical protein
MTKMAKGRQGDWHATNAQTGEELPCLKKHHWAAGPEYHDPHFYDPSVPRNAKYIDAVRQGRVLVAEYENGKRKGYRPGVFLVTDVRNDADGLRCRFIGSERAR